jgi:small conductance mechanosensitive channel
MAATPVDPQTYADRLLKGADDAWAALAHMDAQAVRLNLLLTVAVVLVALAAIWILRRLLDHLLGRLEARSPGSASKPVGAHKAARLTWLLLRILVFGAAAVGVAKIWGVDPWVWVIGGGGRILRLALIVLLATAAVEVAGVLVNRTIEGVARRSGDVRRAAQVRTLGPLLRGVIQTVLVVVGALMLFSELGVKVGPLLASAGVLGIAVGFGAQTLVKDFLTGVFLIAEDVVSLGDNVQIGASQGVVEAMTLRTIRLRDTDGVLHIFPYSEAQVIHNRTKTFSAYVFEFLISYAADVDRALAVMGQVGEELKADPHLGPLIVRPFEVMGVDKLIEAGVLVKARVTTAPREQWRVGREYNRRIKAAFDAQGITMAGQKLPQAPSPEPPLQPMKAGE